MKLHIASLIDAKILLQDHQGPPWDLLISAYNDTDRVQTAFELVPASRRVWWIVPEYRYDEREIAELVDSVRLAEGSEEQAIPGSLAASGYSPGQRLCIDITGMMRPQILYLMAYLKAQGTRDFHLLYTEPEHYRRRAETRFSIGEDVEVKSVDGFIGAHENDMSGDLLVLGVGYDHHLISHALQAKEGARILQLHSFPSLSADMYHESILRLHRVRSERSRVGDEVYFSSANDPFVVASSLASAVAQVQAHRPITNIYLCPLATKPQTIGFGLFYIGHLAGGPASIIFPKSRRYDRETSSGVGRSWIYPIHL